MRKNVKKYLLIVLFIMFFCINRVGAEINSNVSGGTALGSNRCTSGICASTIGFGPTTEEPVDGIKVILKKNNKSYGSVELWFSEDKKNWVQNKFSTTNEKYININDYKNYKQVNEENELFDYANFLTQIVNKKDSDLVESLLQKINSGYTIANKSDYYLVIEPIFVLQYAFNNGSTSGTYYLKGTPASIVDQLINFNKSTNDDAKMFAKYFAYKDVPECMSDSYSGVGSSWGYDAGSCANWYAIANYFTTFKLSATAGPFTHTSGTYAYEFASNYGSNIYGKGILNIGDFARAKITITKTEKDTTTKLQGTKFNLYTSNYNYKATCTTNKSGVCTFENLIQGTYYLKEISPTSKYDASTLIINGTEVGNNYYPVTVGTTDINLTATNTKTCVSEFVNDRLKRIDLYKKYSFRNLLNFEITDATLACSNPTTCSSESFGCVSISKPLNVTDSNLSCYSETVTVGNDTGYCGYSYFLKNKFKGSYQFTSTHNFGTVSSGSLFLKQNSTSGIIAIGELTRYCYVYDTNEDGEIGTVISGEAIKKGDYHWDLYLNGEKLRTAKGPESTWSSEDGSNYKLFEKKQKLYYKLNPVYSSFGSGKLGCSGNSCRFLGYGLSTKLTDEFTDGVVTYSIKYGDETIYTNIGSTKYANACTYSVKNKIIKDDQLNLEFRIIDTLSDFIDKDGEVRQVGANWCDGNDCDGDNSLITQVVKESNNSANIQTKQPLYSITLTPSDIRAIREYNSKTTYDDYILESSSKSSVGSFTNKFLNGLKNGKLKFYDEATKKEITWDVSKLTYNKDPQSIVKSYEDYIDSIDVEVNGEISELISTLEAEVAFLDNQIQTAISDTKTNINEAWKNTGNIIGNLKQTISSAQVFIESTQTSITRTKEQLRSLSFEIREKEHELDITISLIKSNSNISNDTKEKLSSGVYVAQEALETAQNSLDTIDAALTSSQEGLNQLSEILTDANNDLTNFEKKANQTVENFTNELTNVGNNISSGFNNLMDKIGNLFGW